MIAFKDIVYDVDSVDSFRKYDININSEYNNKHFSFSGATKTDWIFRIHVDASSEVEAKCNKLSSYVPSTVL